MTMQPLSYTRPQDDRTKTVVKMARTDVLKADVQYIREGGENNLHSHTGNDGFWWVLEGRVRFYGEGSEPVAELGKGEGMLVPRGTMYWFESAGDEDLEILHVAAFASPDDRRVDHQPRIHH